MLRDFLLYWYSSVTVLFTYRMVMAALCAQKAMQMRLAETSTCHQYAQI